MEHHSSDICADAAAALGYSVAAAGGHTSASEGDADVDDAGDAATGSRSFFPDITIYRTC